MIRFSSYLIGLLLVAGCTLSATPQVVPAPVVTADPAIVHVQLEVKGDVCESSSKVAPESPSPPALSAQVTYHKCPGWAACLSPEELAAVTALQQDDTLVRAMCSETHKRKHR